jgi:hypothetical protein
MAPARESPACCLVESPIHARVVAATSSSKTGSALSRATPRIRRALAGLALQPLATPRRSRALGAWNVWPTWRPTVLPAMTAWHASLNGWPMLPRNVLTARRQRDHLRHRLEVRHGTSPMCALVTQGSVENSQHEHHHSTLSFPPLAARHQERPCDALEGPLRAIGRAEAIVHLDRRSPPPGRRPCRLLQLEPATSLSPSDMTLKPLLLGEHPVDVTMSMVSRLMASSTAPCPVGPESSGKLSPTSTNPPLTSTPLATFLSGRAPPRATGAEGGDVTTPLAKRRAHHAIASSRSRV